MRALVSLGSSPRLFYLILINPLNALRPPYLSSPG
jgi:hypothetical protein